MYGINYLTMQEVAEKLKIKKIDIAKRWCFDNNITILKLGNKKVVTEYDFRLAYEKPIIDNLKQKHPDNWETYYSAYNSQDIRSYYRIENSNKFDTLDVFRSDSKTFLKQIGYEKS